MSARWVNDVQTKIYSIVKAKTVSAIGNRYPEMFFTMDNTILTNPKFPTVYINFLRPSEQGQDLVGTDVNAIRLTVQIDVSVNKSQGLTGARDVSYEVLDHFKELGFSGNMPAFEQNTTDIKRMTMRMSRIIGYNDIL